jgi:5-formyltetrahydrofolate cyclo-ligase
MARDFADKGAARQWVWDRLVAEGVARFPFPPHGRIPNFAGAEVAAARLFNIEPWKSATAIKVNPDSPQRPLRAEALRRGITIFVPTPRLRGGFKKLDPRRIPPDRIDEAASLSRGDRWSEEVALVEMPSLDAIVCGSVAVTRDGRRCGKGEGYSGRKGNGCWGGLWTGRGIEIRKRRAPKDLSTSTSTKMSVNFRPASHCIPDLVHQSRRGRRSATPVALTTVSASAFP